MLEIALYNKRQHEQFSLAPGTWMIGSGELVSGAAMVAARATNTRLVIRDPDLPEDQLQLVISEHGQATLLNLGRSLTMKGGRRVRRGEEISLELPSKLFVAGSVISLHDPQAAAPLDPFLKSIPHSRHAGETCPFSLDLFSRSPAPETIVRWFEALGKMQHSAAGSAEFFGDAAQAVIDTVGLESGLILLRAVTGWEIVASRLNSSDSSVINFQRRILEIMAERKCTIFHDSQAMSGEEHSSTEAVVASPIFNDRDEVVAAVYGVRSPGLKNQRVGVRHLEAQLTQLLAETMTVGLERQRREAEAARTRILLEQAFSPELASQLQRNPELLDGHEREITVLFSDLRGFFEISERLGPHETYRFLGDVMNRLTEAIMLANGVIIDYYGDGLAAMWNAPTDQYNHAELACRAAHAMLEELPAINAAWRESLGQDLALGIGIHTGLARVGNAGTQRRIKYGPRGATVNLASRVEGATKRLGVPLLITEQTRRRLPPSVIARRCLRAQLSGAAAPVDLYEVPRGPLSPEQIARMRGYEEALALFESGDLAAASEHLVAMMRSPSDEDAAIRFLREYIEGLRMESNPAEGRIRGQFPIVELAK